MADILNEVYPSTGADLKRAGRESNVELMRIVLMLSIVMHHYVVNSGVTALWTPQTLTLKAVFLELWGMWGKAAINAFVMVTGWYMCCSRLTPHRYLRLVAQFYFWRIVLWLPFVFSDVPHTGWADVIGSLLYPFKGIDGGFTSSFLAMYLLIPFINRLLGTLDRGRHLLLLAVLLGRHTLTTTLLDSRTAFSEVGWYCTMYLVAAYLHTYKPAWSVDRRKVSLLFSASVTVSCLSVLLMIPVARLRGLDVSYLYFFVSDSGKILAFVTGVTCFLWFKGLVIPRICAINTVAETTFDVLLIHAHSDAMRAWLWGGVVDVPHLYEVSSLPVLAVVSAAVVFAVFAACSFLGWLRVRLLEPPFLRWLGATLERTEPRIKDALRGFVYELQQRDGEPALKGVRQHE